MRLIILTTIFLLFSSVVVFSQGLHINGNNSLIDQRSSYNVFEYVKPTFKNVLRIEFDIFIEVPISRGIITRIKDNELAVIYNLSYFGGENRSTFKLNVEGKDTITSIEIDSKYLCDGHWTRILIDFDMITDSVYFQVKDMSSRTKLEQSNDKWKPDIYFGRSDHIIDVPPFRIRNLSISGKDKKYFFPLNESNGEKVHDSNKREVGHVANPGWLINDSYYWRKGATFSSRKVAGSKYNEATREIYYFNEDSIIVQNILRNTTVTHKYLNKCPISMRLGTNFLDSKNNKLYVYEVADPPIGDVMMACLDLNNFKWEVVSTERLPMQLHHHSNSMTDNGKYIIFGGFGSTFYYNNFFAFDLATKKWEKLEFGGDKISPRYFSSMGYDAQKDELLVFGGMGNESGDQTIGRVYYYELYSVNLKSNVIKKEWSIDFQKENVVPVRNMVLSGDYFYVLCYPEHFSRSNLLLYRFSLADGQYEILGDSIPIISEKITTNANLYFDPHSSQLISLVQEFENDDVASSLEIYTLSFPPVKKTELTLYTNFGYVNYIWIVVSIVVILVLIVGLFLFLKRKKERQTEISARHIDLDKLGVEVKKEEKHYTPNSLYLFGDFSLIDKTGKEIEYMLSTKLKQAFLLVLYYSFKDDGITSQMFSEFLWPDKSYENAKNSRGVTINNLRKVLSELDGLSLLYEKGIYKIVLSDNFYCDYFRCLEIANENNEKYIEEFIQIVSRGKFLKSENASILDDFKEYVESNIESSMYFYIDKAYKNANYQMVILLSDSLFNLDPFDEEALHYLVKALFKLEMKDEAKRRYYQFVVNYKRDFGKEYKLTISDILK